VREQRSDAPGAMLSLTATGAATATAPVQLSSTLCGLQRGFRHRRQNFIGNVFLVSGAARTTLARRNKPDRSCL